MSEIKKETEAIAKALGGKFEGNHSLRNPLNWVIFEGESKKEQTKRFLKDIEKFGKYWVVSSIHENDYMTKVFMK